MGRIWREIFSENVDEWLINAVKKYAKKLKDEEIEHSSLTTEEKAHQKKLWEQWIEETSSRFKEVLGREGRMGDGFW